MLNIYTEKKAGNGEEEKKNAIELVEEEKEKEKEKEKEGQFSGYKRIVGCPIKILYTHPSDYTTKTKQ